MSHVHDALLCLRLGSALSPDSLCITIYATTTIAICVSWRILWTTGEYRARIVVKGADVGSLSAGAVRASGSVTRRASRLGGNSGIFCFFMKPGARG